MLEKRLAYLLDGYIKNTLNRREVDELRECLSRDEASRNIAERMVERRPELKVLFPLREEDTIGRVDKFILDRINDTGVVVKKMLIPAWVKVAAAVIVIVGSIYLLRYNTNSKSVATYEKTDFQIAPGTQKATLTLADGRVVELDKGKSGELARQGASTINLSNGELAYATQNGSNFTGESLMKNTLSTPRGGEYKLLLPDGSKVWLNAASSLRYAPQFSRTKGAPREVELTGEAYFEIAQDAGHPFIVKTPSTKVEVLGTSFNLNAYQDEDAVKATLVEGKVNVRLNTSATISAVLLPGQQAILNKKGELSINKNIDVSSVIAWQHGDFYFTAAGLPDIMRQISRWYDINVIYEGEKNPKVAMQGSFPRSSSLKEVLDAINEVTRIKFRIDGRKVTVL